MRFSMLNAASDCDREKWLALWKEWKRREVSAHPSYASLFAAEGDRVLCSSWASEAGRILFPLILRPLSRELWAPYEEGGFDAITPYGYGGPYSWGCKPYEIREFWSSLRQWAAETKVISLFARLSLFPDQLADFDGTVVNNTPNVVRSLDLPQDTLWMDYDHKVRKNVNRAVRNDVRVEVDMTGCRIDAFLEVYHGTMERRAAAESYFFDRGFFERLVAELPGQFVFFHALHGDKVVSTELVLVSVEYIYSFLGGTRSEMFALRPNDMLKHEIIQWGRGNGKRAFVLGGGCGGHDGIFRYKRAFAPRGVVSFRTGHIIFDPEAYERLIAARQAWEAKKGKLWKPRAMFFPSYRA